MAKALPRVLVTRALSQSSELAETLRTLGAEPVLIPAIETVEPVSFTVLDEALAQLGSFHWLLFTSANAVEAFASRLRATVQQQRVVSSFRIAAIGPATARALASAGLRTDLMPEQAVAESLTAALLPFAKRTDGSPTRFLLVRAEEAREHLPETLRTAGAEVIVAPAYRTVVPEASIALIRTLFADPAETPAAITFTSSSTARNLLALCDAAGVQFPASALCVSIGPITSQTLHELGWPPVAEAPEATVKALARTVMDTIRNA
ncbi:MAG: uroporphyrinogen-III synthase [Janthinobacterium lividum]